MRWNPLVDPLLDPLVNPLVDRRDSIQGGFAPGGKDGRVPSCIAHTQHRGMDAPRRGGADGHFWSPLHVLDLLR